MAPTLAHRAEYAAFRAAEAVFSRLPWRAVQRVGAGLGALWYRLDGRHRRVARENVGAAFPDWPAAAVDCLVRANFEHLGVTAAEFLGSRRLSGADLVRLTRIEGREHLDAAWSRERGVLFLTAHLGNWEFAGLALAARELPFFAIGRRMSNALVGERIVGLRERFGGRLIPHRRAVRPVLKALSAGGLVAFLLDQKPPAREAVASRFFGRPVATNQGLAVLALRTGAPVVPGFCERTEVGHVIHLGPALEPPAEGSLEERVRAFTRSFDEVIETAVRRRPEQWFWVHRRWRIPEGMAL